MYYCHNSTIALTDSKEHSHCHAGSFMNEQEFDLGFPILDPTASFLKKATMSVCVFQTDNRGNCFPDLVTFAVAYSAVGLGY